MSMMILLSVVFLATSQASPAAEEEELCTVEDMYRNCVCGDREEFVVNALITPTITHMSIKGCRKVIVPFSAMGYSELEVLEFSEIEELLVASFALASVISINKLFLNNISNLQLVENSFTLLSNVSKFHMKNVVASTVPKESFLPLKTINEFRVENCTFQHIHEEAFVMNNVDVFEITDSEISYMESRAIFVENASNVLLSANYFSEVCNGSFSLHFVDNFVVHDCQFPLLESWTFTGYDVKVMNFSHNYISILKPFAFSGMNLTETVLFQNNIIQNALNGSLEPFVRTAFSHNINVMYCCNTFTCDCGISWLWNSLEPKEYKVFLAESRCIENETNTLAYYVPILDSKQICTSLELKSFQVLSNDRGVRSRSQNLRNDFKYYAIIVIFLYILYKV